MGFFHDQVFRGDVEDSKLGLFSRRPEDVQQFTAATVAAAAHGHAPRAALYVCGGGAHNAGMLEALARLMAPIRVETTAALGLDPDHVFITLSRAGRQIPQ